MAKCGILNERGWRCVEEVGHAGEHWFQKDANICDAPGEDGYVCTLAPAHDGDHRLHLEATPHGSAVRTFRVDDDPEYLKQRELDALNPPPDLMVPDNSDLEAFIDVLPPQDQVALWAGRIMRKEAQIESMLRMIHHTLSGGGLSWAVVPQLLGRLIDDVRKMIKVSQIEDASYVAECLAAVDRLKMAHNVRNRVVHDQWVMRQEAPGVYVAVNAPKGISGPVTAEEVKWDLAKFRECYEELRFCSVMISGIYWSIGAFIGSRPDIWSDMVPSNREAIAGRFVLTGENHWQFTDQDFVAQLNDQMRKQSEEMRARFAKHFPEDIQHDGL